MASVRPAINPELLQWARRCQRLPRAAAAERLRIPETRLADWESGAQRPTVNQLRQLAQAYRKPFALFFRDDPPEPPEDFPDLRRFFHVMGEDGAEIEALPGELMDAVGDILMRRDVYEELAAVPVFFDLKLNPAASHDEAGARLRKKLSVEWADQRRLRTGNKARNWWTRKIEAIGVLVMQFTAPLEQARGFSIGHARHPVVAANSGDAEFARVFTLIHELVHVALPEDHTLGAREAEEFCNGVAGRTLVPEHQLAREVAKYSRVGLRELEPLSREFGVSRDVVARRLYDSNRLSRRTYDLWLHRIRTSPVSASSSTSGNYYATKVSQLGKPYISAVIAAMEENRITLVGASRALQVKPLNVAKLREQMT